MQAKRDFSEWLRQFGPKRANAYLFAPIIFKTNFWLEISGSSIPKLANDLGKELTLDTQSDSCLWYLENRLTYSHMSDVLWPTMIPDDPHVSAYQKILERAVESGSLRGESRFSPRSPDYSGVSQIFDDGKNRALLEDQFLRRSCQIALDNQIPVAHGRPRPLGFGFGFGFGSLVVTYRNCANNNPLALWWGNENEEFPPLFPRDE